MATEPIPESVRYTCDRCEKEIVVNYDEVPHGRTTIFPPNWISVEVVIENVKEEVISDQAGNTSSSRSHFVYNFCSVCSGQFQDGLYKSFLSNRARREPIWKEVGSEIG